jgi:hypothetical protein
MKETKIKNGKHVYIFESDNNEIKIGVSKSIDVRKRTIENQTGRKIITVYFTELCSNSFSIEKALHDNYQNFKVYGEWYRVKFDEAVKLLNETFATKAEFREREISDPWRLFEYFHPNISKEDLHGTTANN